MKQKLTSALILLILLLNVFFDISVSHHSDLLNKTSAIEITIGPDNYTNHVRSAQDADTCTNGACHSGYCKVLNLNQLHYSYKVLSHFGYSIAVLNMPDGPYLTGNRRPPKHT